MKPKHPSAALDLRTSRSVVSLQKHSVMNGNSTNLTNVTSSSEDNTHEQDRKIQDVCDHMTIVTLCILMLCMGADIVWKQIWEHLKRPVGIAIGMFSQFFIMPLVGFTLLRIMHFKPAHAISILLLSCCPGGAVSNVFTYYLDGDLSLSVTMTSMSTLLALGFMPMNLWIYGSGVDTGTLVIPFESMATSLVYVTSPAVLGMVIKWKFPKVAFYITKIGSICGFLLIVIIITMQNVAYPDILSDIPWKMYFTVIIMPIVGLTLGFILAWVCRRDLPVRKTIAIECGVQNVAIAIGVIALSPFTFQMQKSLLLFPMLYGISMICLCAIICSFYQAYMRFFRKSGKSESDLIDKKVSKSPEKETNPNKEPVFTISYKEQQCAL